MPGVYHGALLYLSDARGDADEQTGLEEREGGDLLHKLLEHPLGHVVIRDDALPQGAHGHDVARGAAQHGLGLGAHLEQLAGVFVHRHHRGLAEDYALTLDIYQNRGGAQVDADILAKETHVLFHLILYSLLSGRPIWAALKRHFLL